MEHTESCKKFRLAYDQRKLNYEAHWGNSYCKTCHGWGYTSYTFDPSPAGVSLGSGFMVETEPCSICSELGICPRCGKSTLDEEDGNCHSCGWQYEAVGSEGLDPEPECECEYIWEEKRYRDYYESFKDEQPGIDWVD